MKSIFLTLFVLVLNFNSIWAQKNSGIFYSTLYAKEGVYLRSSGTGDGADYLFLKDVNGDGLDDAIAIYQSGREPGAIKVALSNGGTFMPPPRNGVPFKHPITGIHLWGY